MNIKEARKKARMAYGPKSVVTEASDPINRNLRKRIGYVSYMPDGKEALFMAGAGHSWEAAFEDASKNPLAIGQMETVRDAMKDLGAYQADPEKYTNEALAKWVEEIKKAQGEKNGEHQQGNPGGQSGGGPGTETDVGRTDGVQLPNGDVGQLERQVDGREEGTDGVP